MGGRSYIYNGMKRMSLRGPDSIHIPFPSPYNQSNIDKVLSITEWDMNSKENQPGTPEFNAMNDDDGDYGDIPPLIGGEVDIKSVVTALSSRFVMKQIKIEQEQKKKEKEADSENDITPISDEVDTDDGTDGGNSDDEQIINKEEKTRRRFYTHTSDYDIYPTNKGPERYD